MKLFCLFRKKNSFSREKRERERTAKSAGRGGQGAAHRAALACIGWHPNDLSNTALWFGALQVKEVDFGTRDWARMAGWAPQNWSELRALRRALGSDEEGNPARELCKELDKQGEQSKRDQVEKLVVRPLGTLGRLALCELKEITDVPSLLMAAVHTLFIDTGKDIGLVVECAGIENQEHEWNAKEHWPNHLPENWYHASSRTFGTLYKISQVKKKQGATAMVLLKGLMMGHKVLQITGLAVEGDDQATPVTMSLSVFDFIAGGANQETISDALVKGEQEPDSLGICGLIPRGSAMQLSQKLREKLVDPLLGKFVSKNDDAGSRGARQSNESVPRNSQGFYPPANFPPRGSPFGIGVGGPAAGFGDPDLYPSFGGVPGPGGIGGGMGGGMLFGPGHPNFGGGRGFPPRPGGVPPGARFDPFGPPGIGGGRGFPPGAGGGRGAGGPGGGPDPDHLPPPGSDDMYW